MTDPTGRSFLSYRRARLEEARLLIEAQHDLGIPTWQDIKDLEEVPTENRIREILDDPGTANALLWLTPDVAESPMIRQVEAPLILDRTRGDKIFFVVPVAAGGLDYKQVQDVLDPRLSVEDLSQWNLRKVTGDPIDSNEAAEAAVRVLRRRIEAIHRTLPFDEPLRLLFYTREKPPPQPGAALAIDWSHRFEGRTAKPGAWEHLLPALREIASVVTDKAPGRRIEVRGLASIPAATALGEAFLAPRGILVSWVQSRPGFQQPWRLEAFRELSGFETKIESKDLAGKDLAVLVSVADNAEPAFSATRPDLPAFRALISVTKSGGLQHSLSTPGEALDVAYRVIEGIREARGAYREIECTHLFMAVPVGLAMLIGQLLNTLGPVQTYDHVETGGTGRYRPAVCLRAAT